MSHKVEGAVLVELDGDEFLLGKKFTDFFLFNFDVLHADGAEAIGTVSKRDKRGMTTQTQQVWA